MNKFIEILARIEAKINYVLVIIVDLIDEYILKRYLPPNVYAFRQIIAHKIEQKKQEIYNKIQQFINKIINYAKTQIIEPLKHIDYKKLIQEKKEALQAKFTVLSDKEFWLKKLQKIQAFWQKIVEKIKKINLLLVFAVGFAGWLLYIASLHVHELIMNYMEKMNQETVYVVKRSDVGPAWPEYRHMDEYIYTFLQVELPVYDDEDENISRELQISFAVRSDNRFLPQYMKTFNGRIRDYLYGHVHLIDGTFLLTSDGKIVIKNKIRDELNKYFAEKKVRGKIIDVYVQEVVFDYSEID